MVFREAAHLSSDKQWVFGGMRVGGGGGGGVSNSASSAKPLHQRTVIWPSSASSHHALAVILYIGISGVFMCVCVCASPITESFEVNIIHISLALKQHTREISGWDI